MGQSYNNLNQINNPPNTTNETTNTNTTEIISYMWIDKDVNKTFFEFEYLMNYLMKKENAINLIK